MIESGSGLSHVQELDDSFHPFYEVATCNPQKNT